MTKPEKNLRTIFGFKTFLPGQKDVINAVLAGRSALAIFPTGQGKSLCYQLPALQLPNLTLVVSPLMALMKDQVDFLVSKGIAAARIDSSLDFNEVNAIYDKLGRNELKLLYVAPERFANERFVGLISRLELSLMVIDEAHCISEWGHNFRPDYLKLAELATSFGAPAVLALTATATPQVSTDICRSFSIADPDCIKTGFYRPNLRLLFAPSENPNQALLQQLSQNKPGASIVYVTQQKTAEKVAALLTESGYLARPYHAGLKNELRQEIQDWFMSMDTAIVVATIAFGMGIDKNNIRYVYHYNLPKSLENYSQEIGRAGRDGQPSSCIMLGSGADLLTLENFVYCDTPDDARVRDCIDFILKQNEFFDCGIYELGGWFDIRPLVIKTLLTYLELEGVIKSTGPFYSSYKFRPLKPSVEILARFDKERQGFLRTLFSCAVKKKIWFTIDLDEAARRTESPRKRVIAALDFLEQSGDLVLEVSGTRLGYRKITSGGLGINELKEKLVKRFAKREQSDLSRLELVVDLVNHQGCKTSLLLNYFGENLEGNCGHCSYCLEGNNLALARKEVGLELLDDGLANDLRQLRAQYPQAMETPRQISRFLCGLPAPMLTKNKMNNDKLFGRLERSPFAQIIVWVAANV
jgi:ATP-dependent DNA helicase RecQ